MNRPGATATSNYAWDSFPHTTSYLDRRTLDRDTYSAMKKIAPAALNTLKAALAQIYWYKNDLRSFLINCMNDTAVLSRLNWDSYKREIVGELVDRLAATETDHQADLLRLMSEVARFDDFSHLAILDDGEDKATRARAAVAALRKQVAGHMELVEEQRNIETRREMNRQAKHKTVTTHKLLEKLRQEYVALLPMPPQPRGYALETLMANLFDLFDLDPKQSFRVRGEQIDGAFAFDGTDYLFEARWRNEPTSRDQLDIFDAKISRKLDNTLGLFLSINGFSEEGVTLYASQRSRMILMDGSDLMSVLEDRIPLDRLLLLKRRHAAQKGQIYVPIGRLLC